MEQKIKLDGRNWHEVYNLPCVLSLTKTPRGTVVRIAMGAGLSKDVRQGRTIVSEDGFHTADTIPGTKEREDAACI